MFVLPLLAIAVYLSDEVNRRVCASLYTSSCETVKVYVLGFTVDEQSVSTAVLAIRDIPDILPEECLEFSHEPKQRHVAGGVDEVAVVDNGYIVPIAAPGADVAPVASRVDGDTTRRPAHEAGEWTDADAVADIARGQVPSRGSVAVCSDLKRANQVFVRCQDVVEVKNHRRIGTHLHEQYVRSVVATLKVTFGCPANTAANRLAVRRSAKHLMVRHTVRLTDIARIIDRVVAGVFIPNEHELLAAKMMQSNTTKHLREELEDARPLSFWRRWWRSSSRGRDGLEVRG